jgi:plasmid stabilization system protein ParE
MALRVSAEAEAELDAIWSYIATESGDTEAADRLVNSITDHFFILSKHPELGRSRDHDPVAVCEVYPLANTSFFTVSRSGTC